MRPLVSAEDLARANSERMRIRLVPIIHYQATCGACGWSGVEWGETHRASIRYQAVFVGIPLSALLSQPPSDSATGPAG